MNAFTTVPLEDPSLSLVTALAAYETFVAAAGQADDEDFCTDMTLAAGTMLDQAVTIPSDSPVGIHAKLTAMLAYAEGADIEADYLKMVGRDLHTLTESTLLRFTLPGAPSSRLARSSLSWNLANHAVFKQVADASDDEDIVDDACVTALKVLDRALRLPAYDLLDVRAKVDAMLLEAASEHTQCEHVELIARDIALLLGSTPPAITLEAA